MAPLKGINVSVKGLNPFRNANIRRGKSGEAGGRATSLEYLERDSSRPQYHFVLDHHSCSGGDMNPEIAAEWALKRACGPCRKNESYEHKGCVEAKEIYDMLASALRVDEPISNGKRIKGWLIPD